MRSSLLERQLDDDHRWLRVADATWHDPLDASFSARVGGRWNPPDSWPTLYLNESLATAQAQVGHLFSGTGIEADDLDDDAPIVLVAATLPPTQRVVDAVSDAGVNACGLPATYPSAVDGTTVAHEVPGEVGVAAHAVGLDGVLCRSATDVGNEVAWFTRDRVALAHPDAPIPFAKWRAATTV